MTSNKVLFVVSSVTENEIEKIIENLKESSCGWVELRPRIMKYIKQSIKIPLTHIRNLSFQTGVFPAELKIANVVPIFKSGDETIFTNYRPVSVLPPVFLKFWKDLCITGSLNLLMKTDYCININLVFKKESPQVWPWWLWLIKLLKLWTRGNASLVFFLDFSKAFDTVDHGILLQKLELYGLQDITLKWCKDYLSNRIQYVTYNGIKSMTDIIKCGVPQGSILGPLLFLMYINYLSQVSEFCLPLLFADDTNLFITGNDTAEMCAKLNDDLKGISEWLCCNKLSLNVSKTHYMVFSPRSKTISNLDVRINNTAIERVYDTKFLGVQIDAQLSWKKNIEYTCNKLSKSVGIILKAKKKLHKAALVTLYYSFAYPYLIYCNLVWGNTYSTNLEKLNILQKKNLWEWLLVHHIEHILRLCC